MLMGKGFFDTPMERIEQDTEQEPSTRQDPPSSVEVAARPRAASKALSRGEGRADVRSELRAEVRGIEPRGAGEVPARADARLVHGGPVVPMAALPAIPAKRYFTIGEVSDLCAVKPYVLRYWEQEFTQLRPMKRRGNRRYYQHHEVLLIRRIRELLYEQGFTISGARNQLLDRGPASSATQPDQARGNQASEGPNISPWPFLDLAELSRDQPQTARQLREALVSIRDLLA